MSRNGTADLPAEIANNPIAWAEGAKSLVAKCEDLGQAQEMGAQAKAALAYLNAKVGRLSEEARAVAEVELLVRQRIGELLPAKGTPKEHGAKGGRGRKGAGDRHPLDHRRASEARALAAIPRPVFDAYLARQRAAGQPPSVSGALKLRKEATTRSVTAPVKLSRDSRKRLLRSRMAFVSIREDLMIVSTRSRGVLSCLDDGIDALDRAAAELRLAIDDALAAADAFEAEGVAQCP